MESRDNNFGLLRLVFASLVILAHSPELVDGDRSREIATQIWGVLTFGHLGVDGFFILSGYLIAKSWEQSASARQYLAKRVLRIYPGFIFASLVSLFVVGPLAGAVEWEMSRAIKEAVKLVLLLPPTREGAFEGLPYTAINGPMWTISYEFKCYLLIMILGLAGLFARRSLILAIAATLMFLTSFGAFPDIGPRITGTIYHNVRFSGLFLVGSAFYLWRDRIVFKLWLAAAAGVALFGCLYFEQTAEPGYAFLGGYVIFWIAQCDWLKPVSRRIRDDVSYGVYLYAWPIGQLFLWYGFTEDPWILAILTLISASICGYASWKLIEKPALVLKPGLHRALA